LGRYFNMKKEEKAWLFHKQTTLRQCIVKQSAQQIAFILQKKILTILLYCKNCRFLT